VADIFLSYKSADRPRAEVLRGWFEALGWSVWIDRKIDLGEGWEARIDSELTAARLIVVLWGAEARHSPWVQREAQAALASGRLLQLHATGLPLLAPFDQLQAVRMQAWSGEALHSERVKLLSAVAERLGTTLPAHVQPTPEEIQLPLHHDVLEAVQLAFYYCARQVESRRLALHQQVSEQSWTEIRDAFSALQSHLREDGRAEEYEREGTLHRMVEDFLDQLELLAPTPGRIP